MITSSFIPFKIYVYTHTMAEHFKHFFFPSPTDQLWYNHQTPVSHLHLCCLESSLPSLVSLLCLPGPHHSYRPSVSPCDLSAVYTVHILLHSKLLLLPLTKSECHCCASSRISTVPLALCASDIVNGPL